MVRTTIHFYAPLDHLLGDPGPLGQLFAFLTHLFVKVASRKNDILDSIVDLQARKPRSYASPKLCPLAYLLTDRGKV